MRMTTVIQSWKKEGMEISEGGIGGGGMNLGRSSGMWNGWILEMEIGQWKLNR